MRKTTRPQAHSPATSPDRLSKGDEVVVTLDGWAHGGEAVGRVEEGPGAGMAIFVGYAIPGETVRVQVVTRKKRWARARLLEVIEASPHRVTPPCPHYGPSACGGCQLQHIAPEHQLDLKTRVLVEQLQRLGGVEDPPVERVAPVADGWPDRYRSWARMAVDPAGRLGFRSPGSNQVHAIDRCLLLDDHAQAQRDALGDDWEGAEELSFLATPEGALAVIHPGAGGLPTAPDGDFGLAIQGADPAPAVIRDPGAVDVAVGDVVLRTSAGAFFQASPATALALAELVVRAAALPDVAPAHGDRLVVLDLYAGVGLLSAFLAGPQVGRLVAVESDPVAVEDARHNLAQLGADATAEVIGADVADALADVDAADVVVLDPPRSGAGREICEAIDALSPSRIVYVACDPAALARDTATLGELGWSLEVVHGLDAFGHTAHVEAVAAFTRGLRPDDTTDDAPSTDESRSTDDAPDPAAT